MELKYNELDLKDKDLIRSYTYKEGLLNCNLSFSNLYAWADLNKTKWIILEGFFVLRFEIAEEIMFSIPMGNGDFVALVEALKEEMKKVKQPLRFIGPIEHMRNMFSKFPQYDFCFKSHRDDAEYIYLREKLITLSGKKLQAKRNKLNKFRSIYPNYRFETLTPAKVDECLALEDAWLSHHPDDEDEVTLLEKEAMARALKHLEALDILGGTLYVEDKMIAFTYGCALNDEAFCTHVEKALPGYEEAFAMINYEFAKYLPENFIYINREEDLGVENLRKAKLSYRPDILLEVGYAKLKVEVPKCAKRYNCAVYPEDKCE